MLLSLFFYATTVKTQLLALMVVVFGLWNIFSSSSSQGAGPGKWLRDVCVRGVSWCVRGPLHHTSQPNIAHSTAAHLLCR